MKKWFQFDFKTRHAGMSTLITVIVLAVLIILNTLLDETSIQIDLTPKKLFTLTDETKAFLDTLDADVEIYALYNLGEEPESVMETLNAYDRFAKNVTVTVMDPDRNPAVMARFTQNEETASLGSIIVASKLKHRMINSMDLYEISYGQQGRPQVLGQKIEQQITAAIAYVSSENTPKIYEVVGHNESTLATLGYANMLNSANYDLSEISLLRSNIPSDAAMLTIVGPKTDFSNAEIQNLEAYLNAGGKLLVAMDYQSEAHTNLYALLRRWDIVVRNGVVFETEANRLIAQFGDNPFVFAPYMSDHETLSSLIESKLDPVLQTSIGFQRTNTEQRRLEYFPLLMTSPNSWLRTEFTSQESLEPTLFAGDDLGPVDVVVAIQESKPENQETEGAAIVAFGSASSLKSLGNLGQIKANADFLMNLVHWLADDESAISVPSKSLFKLPLQIGNLAALLYAAVVILLIPGVCIVGGITVWLRRRHR